MPDPSLFRLRVTFCKQGRLALLSHLELARALERAVRRARLPFAVSQGFSPHMKIAFGAALPVGVGGTRELFDLQMTRYVSPERALEALQAASVPDLMVKSCEYIDSHALAASAAFPVSAYRALLSCAPAQLAVPEGVMVIRKKKEKVLRVAEFLVGGHGAYRRDTRLLARVEADGQLASRCAARGLLCAGERRRGGPPARAVRRECRADSY